MWKSGNLSNLSQNTNIVICFNILTLQILASQGMKSWGYYPVVISQENMQEIMPLNSQFIENIKIMHSIIMGEKPQFKSM